MKSTHLSTPSPSEPALPWIPNRFPSINTLVPNLLAIDWFSQTSLASPPAMEKSVHPLL
jgi:hypothetical protein